MKLKRKREGERKVEGERKEVRVREKKRGATTLFIPSP